MTPEKLCPFDKNPCIRERCAVFHAEENRCGLLAVSSPAPAPARSAETGRKKKETEKPSQYKVHLFD